jgi:hypothetical protein
VNGEGKGLKNPVTRNCSSTKQEKGDCLQNVGKPGGHCDNFVATGNACTGSFEDWDDQ